MDILIIQLKKNGWVLPNTVTLLFPGRWIEDLARWKEWLIEVPLPTAPSASDMTVQSTKIVGTTFETSYWVISILKLTSALPTLLMRCKLVEQLRCIADLTSWERPSSNVTTFGEWWPIANSRSKRELLHTCLLRSLLLVNGKETSSLQGLAEVEDHHPREHAPQRPEI
jgi:hypothetical protein